MKQNLTTLMELNIHIFKPNYANYDTCSLLDVQSASYHSNKH